jgi:AcrR family transcriptional regulator
MGLIPSDTRRAEASMRESNTKQLILVEATHLFYERGFAGASIGDIVRAVGVSRAAVYIYFRDKDHMLFEIIEGIGSVVLGKLYPLIEIYDDPLGQCDVPETEDAG